MIDPRVQARVLRDLRDRLRRLMLTNGKPEQFHVEKDALCNEIGKVADQLDPRPQRPQPSTVWRPS